MTYILTICVGFSTFFGLCGQYKTLEFQNLEACMQEREALIKFKDVSWVTCEQKKGVK